MHCDWFILPLLLPTPTIWFSLDHKRNVSDGVVSGIGTLFSLDHKLYASNYDSDSDSDSVASKNQPLVNKEGSRAQYAHQEAHFQRPKNKPALEAKCTRAATVVVLFISLTFFPSKFKTSGSEKLCVDGCTFSLLSCAQFS